MPLDPSTLCARTAAGDAELAAPRHGLAIAQRRLLSLLDHPAPFDELLNRPGLMPQRLEKDLGRLAEHGLVQLHAPSTPSVSRKIAPVQPVTQPRPGEPRQVSGTATEEPPRPWVPAQPGLAATMGSNAPESRVVAGKRVRHGRALLLGLLTLIAVGAAVWWLAAPAFSTAEPSTAPRSLQAAAFSEGSGSSAKVALPVAVADASAQRPNSAESTRSAPGAALPAVAPQVLPVPDRIASAPPPAQERSTPPARLPPAAAPAKPPPLELPASIAPPAVRSPANGAPPVAQPLSPEPTMRVAATTPPATVAQIPPAVPSPVAAGQALPPATGAIAAAPLPSAGEKPTDAPQVRPAPSTTTAPVRLATASPPPAPVTSVRQRLVPLTREEPDFPREALAQGITRGSVRVRLAIDASGKVAGVEILAAEPRRVFDRAVVRALSRWTYEPGEPGRSSVVEVAFNRE